MATIDWFQSPPQFYTFFYAGQLAPDDKIYINCSSSTDYMHIIHSPNEQGLACNLEQHGLKLSGLNAVTMPHFPNYRLYDMPESPCDSLGINAPTVGIVPISHTPKLSISPNPSTAETTLSLPIFTQGQWFLTDISGKMVQKGTWWGNSLPMKVQDYPPGLYFFQLLAQDGRVFVGKLLVQR